MSVLIDVARKKEARWTPALIRLLRGKRTQTEFGSIIGVPKNTVWRWEAGLVKPDLENEGKLSRLARLEHFLEDWQLVGSMELVGDLETASKKISKEFEQSLHRTASSLRGSVRGSKG